ncbi:uncharacterized protein LOC116851395 [Odontomachus brunneus]|uniref:uncharacterized protein LOC116851395 n=1 Tax=Odontomachus brunneus TaxID=486640 RepID=UPI0013F27C34|nr:uncharacterized protein LOC116851395 [Odontomachus brunneus]
MANLRDRDNHCKKKIWPKRTLFEPGSNNIIVNLLVDPKKVLLPSLHIKLGLMKQFVKALKGEGKCFEYLGKQFPGISDAKLKEGIFDGSQIRKMLKDENFIKSMNQNEKAAWISFKKVVQNFLGNHKSDDYEQIIADMVKNLGKLGCLMNLKLHFLNFHLDYFPMNLGDYSEEQGERFHQDLKVMERRYQGRWGINMMADYCSTLKRENVRKGVKRKRKPLHRSFEDKRVRYYRKK